MDNRETVQRYVDELNRRNLAVLDDLVADRVTMRSLSDDDVVTVTRAEYRQDIENRIAAAPDYHVTMLDTLQEGDRVMLHWQRQFTNAASTAQSEHLISIYRLAAGRIVEVAGFGVRAG